MFTSLNFLQRHQRHFCRTKEGDDDTKYDEGNKDDNDQESEEEEDFIEDERHEETEE